ncbi:MAG TPA: response regulator [Candidatus Deferrimicrobium sp.]
MGDRILIVDDEASLRDALARILTAEGYEVRQAGDGKEALGILGASPFDFLLCDLRMPVMGGLDLLREITARGIPGTVIMMSAFGTVETAVEAMKLGAYDYVSKPFMSDEILLTLRKAAERERLRTENAFLRSEIEKAARPEEILYASGPMEEVVRTAGKVKDYDATVLVTGESGTGKELVARLLHFGGASEREAVRRRQLRGDPGNASRERALRPPPGSLHRGEIRPGRPDRGGRRRHALS